METNHLIYMQTALEEAKKSTCMRRRCGSVIVKNNIIIGKGYNSPPGNKESQRRCQCDKKKYHEKITDKTCCIHAEQRAILDALIKSAEGLQEASLYFIAIDKEGKMIYAGQPYCTQCSKLALDTGITKFILWHEEGIRAYDAEEYNKKSYDYQE